MEVLPLGIVVDCVFAALGEHVLSATLFDMSDMRVYGPGDVTDVYHPETNVYLMHDWHIQSGERHVWRLGRLAQDPIIITGIMPEKITHVEGSKELPHTAVEIEKDGHTFDPLDMTWICKCGHYMEPDAERCGDCGEQNPFLGMIL